MFGIAFGNQLRLITYMIPKKNKMRKIIYVALLSAFLISCASHPGRVCGGAGGGRVVENTTKTIYNQPIA